MIGDDKEGRLLENAKDLLNRAAENLDSDTGQRLECIRTKALRAAEEKPSRFFSPLRWILIGGFGTATMAAVALFFWLNTSLGDFPAKHAEDLEIITSGEPIDFYQHLEFYRWMATPKEPPDRVSEKTNSFPSS